MFACICCCCYMMHGGKWAARYLCSNVVAQRKKKNHFTKGELYERKRKNKGDKVDRQTAKDIIDFRLQHTIYRKLHKFTLRAYIPFRARDVRTNYFCEWLAARLYQHQRYATITTNNEWKNNSDMSKKKSINLIQQKWSNNY